MKKEKPKLFWNLGFILQFHNLLVAYKDTFIRFANILEVTRVEQRGYHSLALPGHSVTWPLLIFALKVDPESKQKGSSRAVVVVDCTSTSISFLFTNEVMMF